MWLPPPLRFLDRGLDEAGPKGLDFLTVLAAHEGEGLVVDRWGQCFRCGRQGLDLAADDLAADNQQCWL